ncbi:hypothetical protein M427DRAFT_140711 [Gonapodya prolifera JEL478]|uniref:C2H2-type domain-containing protein n=1 Tax=Gonapodya prolifera (strain JEL478) TaxID=1344416 RepID=A0A138ZYJ6_GONPJ|nr:hypothetical protein M427DRAFT_140711 [Gonapodya prolifera JEL478]|eukprot:KXS09560.1 hypothetical protein M427DRAFT_140711 [Gonapodya prolifera JEL478]
MDVIKVSPNLFVCPICHQQFTRKFNGKEHLKIHEPERQHTHICRWCNQGFYRSGDLNRHELTHTGIPSCRRCGCVRQGFVRPDRLHNHERKCQGNRTPVAPAMNAFSSSTPRRNLRRESRASQAPYPSPSASVSPPLFGVSARFLPSPSLTASSSSVSPVVAASLPPYTYTPELEPVPAIPMLEGLELPGPVMLASPTLNAQIAPSFVDDFFLGTPTPINNLEPRDLFFENTSAANIGLLAVPAHNLSPPTFLGAKGQVQLAEMLRNNLEQLERRYPQIRKPIAQAAVEHSLTIPTSTFDSGVGEAAWWDDYLQE